MEETRSARALHLKIWSIAKLSIIFSGLVTHAERPSHHTKKGNPED